MDTDTHLLAETRIEEILPLIPTFLHQKISWCELETIADVLAIEPDDFGQVRGIGSRAVVQFAEFQKELRNNPAKYIKYIERQAALRQVERARRRSRGRSATAPILIPERVDPARPFFVNFVLFEEEMARCTAEWGAQAARNQVIIRSLFGIHCRASVMERVGADYDITRERVRQVKASTLVTMRKMLSGKTVPRPARTCPADLARQFLTFWQEHVSHRTIIPRPEIIALIPPAESNPRAKDISEAHIDLLMEILGYAIATYREYEFYYCTERFNRQTLRAAITEILRALQDRIHPVRASDVTKQITVAGKDRALPVGVVQSILEELPECEYVTADGRSGFQLRFDRLSNSGTMAMRILRDAGTPMHFREIVRDINQRLFRFGGERIVLFSSVIAQLVKSDHASAVSKTGYWTLTEWRRNTGTILELMVSVLRARGAPMTVEELYEQVTHIRPEAKKKTLAKMLADHKEAFVRLESGKVTLASSGDAFRPQ